VNVQDVTPGGPVLYGQDGYFFSPERLAVWDRELRAGGLNAGAMPVMAVGPLLSARYGMGVEQAQIAGLALRRWMADSRS
jgi:hypothetical protein